MAELIKRRGTLVMGDAPPHDPEPITGYTKYSTTIHATNADPVDIFTVVTSEDTEAKASFESMSELNGGSSFSALTPSEIVDAIKEIIEGVAPEAVPPTTDIVVEMITSGESSTNTTGTGSAVVFNG